MSHVIPTHDKENEYPEDIETEEPEETSFEEDIKNDGRINDALLFKTYDSVADRIMNAIYGWPSN